MVCFRYIIVSTVRKGDRSDDDSAVDDDNSHDDDNDDDDNNNNNNNKTNQGGKVTILWNQQAQTDRTIPNNKPDIII